MDDTAVDIGTAATRLGLSTQAVRKRLQRGQLHGFKIDGLWRVVLDQSTNRLPDGLDQSRDCTVDSHATEPDTSPGPAVLALVAQLEAKDRQLLAREREVQELHVLLQRALEQRTPELPAGRPAEEVPAQPKRQGWRFWKRSD